MSWELVGGVVGISALLWGVYTTRHGWRHSNATRRAELVRGYTNDFYQSDALPNLFLDIDQGRFRFPPEAKGTPEEMRLAHLLDFFNTLGKTVEEKIVSIEDLQRTTIGYAALVTWKNREIQDFLAAIEDEDLRGGLPVESFGYFRALGKTLASAQLTSTTRKHARRTT